MKLRLLLILPLQGGSLVVGRHLADALRDFKHIELDVFHTQPLCSFYEKSFRHVTEAAERQRKISEHLNLAALGRIVEFKPDLVLVMALAPVVPWLIEQTRQLGTLTAQWYIENFRYYPAHPLIPKWQAIAPCYDWFFTIQKTAFFEALQAIGPVHYAYLPTGCNPRVHHSLSAPATADPAWPADIAFIGAPYPNRIALFKDLLEFNLALWGPGWPAIPGLQSAARGEGRWIDGPEECLILNHAKIALNIHSTLLPDRLIERSDFLNPRVFTAAACGAFQLLDDSELLREVFEPDIEVALYHDPASLKEQITRYLNDPDQRSKMACKAHARALEEHTYARRAETMLRIMNLM